LQDSILYLILFFLSLLLILQPAHLDARFGKKRDVEWKGYKVHLTECCDQDLPLVITDVQTTHAATTDFEVLDKIQADLAARDLLAEEHIVDSGYMTGEHLVRSQNDYDIRLGRCSPIRVGKPEQKMDSTFRGLQ
jgi:transposase